MPALRVDPISIHVEQGLYDDVYHLRVEANPSQVKILMDLRLGKLTPTAAAALLAVRADVVEHLVQTGNPMSILIRG